MRKANSGLLLRPLTHKNSQGIPYIRDSKVEMQIVAALGLDTASLLERVRLLDYKAPDYLQEECLIYLIREYLKREEHEIVRSIFEALTSRSARFIVTHFLALQDHYREEAFNEVLKEIVRKIFDLEGNGGDFFEVRFWLALERIIITVFNIYIDEQNKDENAIRPAGIGGSDRDDMDEDNPDRSKINDIASPYLPEDLRVQCREGLKAIKNPLHRKAFVLVNYYGWPIESIDPDEPTISGYFKKTPRTIRNWIACAEQDLKRWRGEIKA